MKKLIMTAAVVACASIVSAQVVSDNIVGYTKVTAVGGELSLVSLNFNTGGALVGADLCANLPALSSVYVWDKVSQTYLATSKNTRGAWVGDVGVDIGDAFWIEAAGAGSTELVFAGEVLQDPALIPVSAGLTATGYFFPVAKDVTTTQIAADLPALSSIYVWDNGLQVYAAYSKNTRGAWAGSGNKVLDPKGGFWIENASGAFTTTEPVPFTP